MQTTGSADTTRRGLLTLALVLVLVALVLAPSAPAGPTGAVPATGSDGWAVGPIAGSTAGPITETQGGSAAGVPVSLAIPALGVAAHVDEVTTDADGALAPPGDPARVGWWTGGALPGSRQGAVLLAGHTVRDGDGVFDNLALLEPGDVIEVVTRGGATSYAVEEVRDLGKEELAAASHELFAVTGHPRIVLVTCTDWDGGRYLGNTVVVGVPDAAAEGS